MTFEIIVGAIFGGLLLMALALIVHKRRPRKLNPQRFEQQWQELQKLLADQSRWAEAIERADQLLDEALKRRRFRGKSMGERLVRAQKVFTDNDRLWYGHKLRMKLQQDENVKLKQGDVKQALIGIRLALKDLGAFGSNKEEADAGQ